MACTTVVVRAAGEDPPEQPQPGNGDGNGNGNGGGNGNGTGGLPVSRKQLGILAVAGIGLAASRDMMNRGGR